MIRELLFNGEKLSFRIESGTDGASVTIGEETHDLNVQELAPGRWMLRHAAGQQLVHAVRSRDRIWVWLNGRTYEFYVPSPDDAADHQRADAGDDVRAPMPGLLVKLLVAAGDDVESGQVVAVVEAMKMEHTLRAPRSGVVESVAGAAGETVDAGAVIVTFVKTA